MAGLHDMTPMVSRRWVSSTVRAPARAAAEAASQPAWPPPITTTSAFRVPESVMSADIAWPPAESRTAAGSAARCRPGRRSGGGVQHTVSRETRPGGGHRPIENVRKCHDPSWRFGLTPNSIPCRPGPRSGAQSRPERFSQSTLEPGSSLRSVRGDEGGFRVCQEMSCSVMALVVRRAARRLVPRRIGGVAAGHKMPAEGPCRLDRTGTAPSPESSQALEWDVSRLSSDILCSFVPANIRNFTEISSIFS